MESQNNMKTLSYGMAKGMVIAYALTCLIFITYGILLTYTKLSEQTIPIVSLVTTAICAGLVGFDWANVIKQKGVFVGIGAGLVYVILLYIITAWGSGDFSIQSSMFRMVAVALAGGGIGGILGVNKKS